MGRRRNSSRLQRGKPQFLLQLPRNYAVVNPRKGVKSHHAELNERSMNDSKTAFPQSTSWLSNREIVHGSDRNSAHHSGTIPGVEFAPEYQLHRL
ncbi:hypothetical protein DPMN_008504 [Dreissena polymorpha]|uniref:Uncharacterized protein n=1 Tax=Dreissena polymorpha TaxID=45954 RepID=A0A9D4RZQ8_DREPO|nr:hypothetical protein DPMN_008504 [Dreissena polymorpha]